MRSVQDMDSLAHIHNHGSLAFSEKNLFRVLYRYDLSINTQLKWSKRAGMEGCFQILCFHNLNIRLRYTRPSFFAAAAMFKLKIEGWDFPGVDG
jgi:hypothetical protein